MTIKQIPNFITALRIAGTFIMLFMEPFTIGFYALYTFCGFTDILDGYIARKHNLISELGARLDSIADILYYAVMILIILPVLIEVLPVYIWYMFFGVVFVRILSYVIAAIRYKRFASHHTYMNKVSGFSAFLMPYFIKQAIGVEYCTLLGIIVSTATLEELLMHIVCKEYHPDMKTIFHKEIHHSV